MTNEIRAHKQKIRNHMKELLALNKTGDTEIIHRAADDLLCELLLLHGEDEIVEDFKSLDKWYA